MATQPTPRAALQYWQLDDPNWHLPYQATCLALDAVEAIGSFAVTPAEGLVSASLNVAVAAGKFRTNDGSIATYAGTTSQALPASSTRCLWLDNTATLQVGSSFPTSPHVRLATVTTGASTITSIVDSRIPWHIAGNGPRSGTATLSGGTVTITDPLITAASVVIPFLVTPGGTPGFLYKSAVVAGTSFTITSTSNTDTSTVGYLVREP